MASARNTTPTPDALISQERNDVDSYYLVDGLGSTKGLTDENGNVTDVYSYDAYGNLIDSVGNSENDYLFAGEQFDSNLDQYYLRQRYYDPSVGRFTRRDTYEGRNNEPITLHKYLYANGNPVSYIDPSGLASLPEINSTFVLQNVLTSLAFSVPLRTVEAAKNLASGADLAKVAGDVAFGVAFDVGVGLGVGVTLAGVQRATSLFRIRLAGQSTIRAVRAARAPNSIWNVASAVERGRHIEQMVLGRPASLRHISNFPVIDDFVNGVATSIKSLDLTLTTYAKPSRLINKLDDYASKLARFNGRTWGGTTVPSPSERVLVVAIENGVMTRAQAQAITQFLKEAPQRYGIRIVFSPIP
ncbi:RHS repeat-associated core domain-containing protein [Spirulina sp. 06S082]|uniref:RHS repeat-associated core domain-containing protein n=1 Tax=Spirulina sp. 06S082 TaxID=3110248 RepID=UPI002B210313|nr:RHS repeat-associated core domain-containing protein [Spirulina sp. 06S082]MEA5470219.1 RHS repeat-associated core domain-containing protein [Spirulina sp. 06S082]